MPGRPASFWRVLRLALSACIALSPFGDGLSAAGEPPQQPLAAESPPNAEASPATKVMDQTHSRIEREILERVVWFDTFFGNVKTEDFRRPQYELRWLNSLRAEKDGGVKYRTSVRAHLVLPRISERLHLVIAGESEAEPSAARLPEDPGNPGFDRTLQNTRLVNTELRYNVLQEPAFLLFLGAGVRVKLPLESFVRSRFQYTRRIGAASLVRFGETVFWRNTDGFGETTDIDLERQLGPKTLLRWANSGTLSQESAGLEWGTELSLLRQFSARSAITLGGGVFGVTRPVATIQNYRVFTRYRRNFLRRWLFFELEPEVTWPRDVNGAHAPAYAFTFRVEVVFQGKDVVSGT